MMETTTIATASSASKASRLGNCEVCARQAARYACPKCEVKTCCVECVQIHKRELLCDGKRDRTKFMPISDMTEREFMSDYCFLEECTRYTEHRKQDPSKRHTQQQRQLPMPLHRLRAASAARGVRLLFMLANFTRHKENKTYLNWKERRIYWQIEWLFVHTTGESTRFVDRRCSEDQTLAELLLKYLDPLQPTACEQRKVLHHHQSAGIGQVSIWLKAQGVRRSGHCCYRLAAQKTLRSNLAGKTIVEYPAIYISYEQRPPLGCDVIDSDEEVEAAKLENVQAKPHKPSAKRPKAVETSEQPDIYALVASFGSMDRSSDSSISSNDVFSEDEAPPAVRSYK